MTQPPPGDDAALLDRVWAGYHPRAAVPAVAAATAASVSIWLGRWYLSDLSELADRVGALAVFAMAWCVWPAVAAVYLYRAITYTYRLTDRAVLIDFGFWFRPTPPVWLKDVIEVRAGGWWLSRLLGVGWVDVRTTTGRRVRLPGVRHAAEFGARIRAAADDQKTPWPAVTL